MRIAIGGISHETSTFTSVATDKTSFSERYGELAGAAVIDKFRGANTPIGGFIAVAEERDFELIPTVFYDAMPSAPASRTVFDQMLGDLVDGIAAARSIDGVLLELHGSMVAEGIDDGEGSILKAVRECVGEQVPIVAQLDIHSNVSEQMVNQADVLIGRESYPEVDMAERGRECAEVMVRIVRRGLRPTMALHQIPMIWGLNQVTAHPPMREAIDYLHEIESRAGVVCASISTGFPLADVPDLGASVHVVTDDDVVLAQACADELGAWLYARRADWHSPMPSTAQILAGVSEQTEFPLVISDRFDNTGGGSPGDSTGMLQTFIEQKLDTACLLYMVDPAAANACIEAGVGAELELEVGAKSSPLQGVPCRMRAEVVAISDGTFTYDGPMYAGLDGHLGSSAHIRQDGMHVLLVSERGQPFDTAFARSLGLEPRSMRYIGVKSSAHFRAGFESWAGSIRVAGEPSVHNPARGKLAFNNTGRPLYPLDAE